MILCDIMFNEAERSAVNDWLKGVIVMKKLLSLVLVCLLVLALTPALAELDESNPVVISMCGAITGSYSDYGLGYRAATQVQVDK